MSEKLNIEQLFKSKLENLEQTPSPDAWIKTSRALRRKQFLRFNPRRFNLYYGIGALLIATGLAIAFIDMPSGVSKEEASGVRREALGEETISANDTLTENTYPEASEATVKSQTEKDQTARSKDTSEPVKTESEKAEEASAYAELRRTKQGEVTKKEKASEPETSTPEPVQTLIAYFTPSVTSGCPPLEVSFVNNSANALNTYWTISGEKQLAEGSFKYTFRAAGNYVVTLTAVNASGLEKSYSETINVHPKPTAEFEIVDNEVYNYSLNATAFEWKLLTGNDKKSFSNAVQISNDFQPDIETTLHLTPNAQSLALFAKNSYGCTDTTLSVLPEETDPKLTFPSAFNPNPNGSTGGYYNPLEPTNRVFHPRYNEEPATYNLKIFNKQGEIIFETNDIHIGWDGYHKEAPAAQGVYIYQATGTWKNGAPFNYRGDITILWSKN